MSVHLENPVSLPLHELSIAEKNVGRRNEVQIYLMEKLGFLDAKAEDNVNKQNEAFLDWIEKGMAKQFADVYSEMSSDPGFYGKEPHQVAEEIASKLKH